MSAQGSRRGETPGHHSSQPCSGEVSSKNFARDMGYVADFRRRLVRRCWHSPTRRTRAFCPCWANLWLSLPYRRERHKNNKRHGMGGILCHAFSIGEENLPLEGSETLEPVKCCRTGILGMEFLKMGRIKNATFYGRMLHFCCSHILSEGIRNTLGVFGRIFFYNRILEYTSSLSSWSMHRYRLVI